MRDGVSVRYGTTRVVCANDIAVRRCLCPAFVQENQDNSYLYGPKIGQMSGMHPFGCAESRGYEGRQASILAISSTLPVSLAVQYHLLSPDIQSDKFLGVASAEN